MTKDLSNNKPRCKVILTCIWRKVILICQKYDEKILIRAADLSELWGKIEDVKSQDELQNCCLTANTGSIN